MATYQVTGPDGHKYRVTGPDGATDEQVLGQIEAYSKQSPTPEPGIPDSKPMAPTPRSTEDAGGSFFNKLPGALNPIARAAVGAGETGLAMATGAAAPFVGIARGEKGRADNATTGYQPRTAYGRDFTQNLGEGVESVGKKIDVPGLSMALGGLGGEMQALGRAVPAVGRAAGDVAGRAGEAVGSAFKVSPEIAELAQKAQAAGIPLRPDMLTNSRIAKMVGDTLEKVPLSGDMAGKRQIAFNQAVIETIGGDTKATKLTPDVYRKAMSTTGQAIGDLAAKYDVPMDGGLKGGLAAIEKGADFEPDSTARILKKYVDEIRSHADASGKIDGTTFRKIRTQLTGQMRRTNDGDLKYALSNLDEVMLDSVKSQMTPGELTTFGDLRRKYANGKSLEPLVAKGDGDISASKLMARMTATGSGKSAMAKGTGGDLGDIARIGQKFLGEPPTPRNTAYGVLGEIGAGAVAPGTTSALVGASNVYNRMAPRIAKGMIERSKVKPPVQP